MDTLGDDLVLLAIRRRGISRSTAVALKYCLAASEVARLAHAGYVTMADDRAVPVPGAPDPGPVLAKTWSRLREMDGGQPKPVKQVIDPPPYMILADYLRRLDEDSVLTPELKATGAWKVRVLDKRRVRQARERLDAIAYATGPADVEARALGGLVFALGDDVCHRIYPGRRRESVRHRLAQLAGSPPRGVEPLAEVLAERSFEAAEDATSGALSAMVDSVNASIKAAEASWAASHLVRRGGYRIVYVGGGHGHGGHSGGHGTDHGGSHDFGGHDFHIPDIGGHI